MSSGERPKSKSRNTAFEVKLPYAKMAELLVLDESINSELDSLPSYNNYYFIVSVSERCQIAHVVILPFIINILKYRISINKLHLIK